MEAQAKIKNGQVVEIDGLQVLYVYKVALKDFEKLTLRVAKELRLPFEIAICESKENPSGIAVYIRYFSKWVESYQYCQFLIAHLLKTMKPHD